MNAERSESAVPKAAWFKSSYSTGGGGECVEVATMTASVHVRDSKNLTGPELAVDPHAWSSFIGLITGPSA
ncbi:MULTISPECIES: DUF397 domain-containing protein [Streptomyces]|uniref:DUF397 domain-containing protein n=2 Tax=Streptomyces TaxID=1883 RepID=A0A420V5K7_9ACTN|nr:MULTISPECIES: DUF397 domain-containing protein [Streptomyces]KNE81230.1 hypothetical protein ADZ36_17555 [Streptomyces fradiae]OFA46743.1 DUF397 domain-containing protein [Streptomyces fradiae]PQM22312.1 DUF397 domain-containing protein [Streptomyces xinghaiensis]RKM96720.1 DUF397 domain-containing protein [Streptomyces xinghaiensis]RNC74128.1 DUF397 domain-containing protein [Streptomyces xinghaiensis]